MKENLGHINSMISEVHDILESIETTSSEKKENLYNGDKYRDKK